MLLGLALIAGPLLVAIVDAVIQIRSLTKTSQELVENGVNVARLSQSMLADINSLQRFAGYYQVLGAATLARQLSRDRPEARQHAQRAGAAARLRDYASQSRRLRRHA